MTDGTSKFLDFSRAGDRQDHEERAEDRMAQQTDELDSLSWSALAAIPLEGSIRPGSGEIQQDRSKQVQ